MDLLASLYEALQDWLEQLAVISIDLNFDWNPDKAKQNLKKHKVSFERATTIFQDPAAVSVFDEEHSDDEGRWVTLGKSDQGEILVVIHTFREVTANSMDVRIISARGATKRERQTYEGIG
jgi:uncharacterized DUF497 family protein